MSIPWQPIANFNPEEFEDGEYLVWIIDEDGDGSPFMAEWHHDINTTTDDNGRASLELGDARHQGDWRYMGGFEGSEPVAFARIDPYSEPASAKPELDAEIAVA